MSKERLKAFDGGAIVDIQVDSPLHFLRLLSPLSGAITCGYHPDQFIYRGTGTHHDTLIPSAFREDPDGGGPERNPESNTILQQIYNEFEMFRRFFECADAQGLAIPEDSQMFRYKITQWSRLFACKGVQRMLRGNGHKYFREFVEEAGWENKPEQDQIHRWPPREFYSTLGLMQHYYMRTRLLDWSWSPFVAAYFAASNVNFAAVSKQSGAHVCVWTFDVAELKQSNPTDDSDDDIRLITAPTSDNDNLRAQKGVFLCHTVNLKRRYLSSENGNGRSSHIIEYLQRTHKVRDYRKILVDETAHAFPAAGSPKSNPLIYRLRLKGKSGQEDLLHAKELLRLLGNIGVDASTIFPGFEGVGRFVKERMNAWPKEPVWKTRYRDSELSPSARKLRRDINALRTAKR